MTNPTRKVLEQWRAGRKTGRVKKLADACLNLLDENERQAVVIETTPEVIEAWNNYISPEDHPRLEIAINGLRKALARLNGGDDA